MHNFLRLVSLVSCCRSVSSPSQRSSSTVLIGKMGSCLVVSSPATLPPSLILTRSPTLCRLGSVLADEVLFKHSLVKKGGRDKTGLK